MFRTQVLVAHSRCVNSILRFSLLERIKTLSTIAIIWWNCRESCWKTDQALKYHCGRTTADGLSPAALLNVALDPRFQRDIASVELGFDAARCPAPPLAEPR